MILVYLRQWWALVSGLETRNMTLGVRVLFPIHDWTGGSPWDAGSFNSVSRHSEGLWTYLSLVPAIIQKLLR